MARTRYKPEDIVAKLRQVDVLTSQGRTLADAIRQIGVSEVTYYRWRQEVPVAAFRNLMTSPALRARRLVAARRLPTIRMCRLIR
jgi:ACT domain-containing protein